jgi:hypothetical protein
MRTAFLLMALYLETGYLVVSAIAVEVIPVMTEIMAIETEVAAIIAGGVEVAFSPVTADIEAVMVDIHPVITCIPAIIPVRILGLGSGSGEDQADCDQYGNFRVHNIHFYLFSASIPNSYIRRRGERTV